MVLAFADDKPSKKDDKQLELFAGPKKGMALQLDTQVLPELIKKVRGAGCQPGEREQQQEQLLGARVCSAGPEGWQKVLGTVQRGPRVASGWRPAVGLGEGWPPGSRCARHSLCHAAEP